jgi:hypothetical protein
MSQRPREFLGKHKNIIVTAIAISVLAMYVLPLDYLAAAVGGKSVAKNDGGADKGNKAGDKEKDNNCENGLPPHKNGNSDNGNHYGCVKHL